MISTSIAPVLRAASFKKRRNSFSRQHSGGWQLIDFQASQFSSRDKVSFTINLGLAFVEIPARSGGPPTLGRAHVRQRIGGLRGSREDKWWTIDGSSDYDAVSADVLAAVRDTGVPWLKDRATLAQVLDGVRSGPAEFLARWQIGGLGFLLENAGLSSEATDLREIVEHLDLVDSDGSGSDAGT